MALPTSNLSVKNDILATLGVATAKAIFYTGSTLKTIGVFGALVQKDGLDATYCPGADADARLQNLLTDRKLIYFKGYEHDTKIWFYNNGVENDNFSLTISVGSGMALVKNTGNLQITKTGADSTRCFVLTDVDSDSSITGKTLYVKYELVSGEVFVMEFRRFLTDGSTIASDANVTKNSFSTLGIYTENSGGTAPFGTLHPGVKLETGSAGYVFKIFEIYYD